MSEAKIVEKSLSEHYRGGLGRPGAALEWLLVVRLLLNGSWAAFVRCSALGGASGIPPGKS